MKYKILAEAACLWRACTAMCTVNDIPTTALLMQLCTVLCWCGVVENGSPYTFSVKPIWQTVVFCFFCRALLSWSVFVHIAPSRIIYGRCSKALWRFHGDLVACRQGVHGQPFSTPLYRITYAHAHTHVHTPTTCTDLQHHLGEVDPVHQEVVMWSVREDSQHVGYRQW